MMVPSYIAFELISCILLLYGRKFPPFHHIDDTSVKKFACQLNHVPDVISRKALILGSS